MAEFAPQYNLYKIIEKVKLISSACFWFIFLLSITPPLVYSIDARFKYDGIVNSLNIIFLLTYFVLEILSEYILVPQAESKRRDDFIDNSFNSKFSPNKSVGYYDNDEIEVGLYKAACNLFENCFFTYSLIKAITFKNIIQPAIILLTVIVFACIGFNKVPIALSFLQILFSANILGSLIKHFILLTRLNIIQDSWIEIFQHSDLKNEIKKYEANIYRYWLQYETLHSRIQSGVPEKVFNKLNPILTREWMELKKRYKIN